MRRALLAEYVGTAGLVFLGCGAIMLSDHLDWFNHLWVSMSWGAAVAAMIYAFGAVSGAHINPAVSVAFVVAGKLPKDRLLSYVSVQIAGALTGAGLLKLMQPDHPTLGSALPSLDVWIAASIELVLTFLLMSVVIYLSTGFKQLGKYAGLLIGFTVFLEAYFAGPYTGASMNPARSLGPAVMSGNLDHLALYLPAILLGALLAIPTCRLFRKWDSVDDKDCCVDC